MIVTFIGIHYKQGMSALDGRTRSGKKIDKVVEQLDCECVKCNLFQGFELPPDKEEREVQKQMLKTIIHDQGIFVLLGGDVQKHFPYSEFTNAKIIKYRHPSFSKKSYSDDLLKVIVSK